MQARPWHGSALLATGEKSLSAERRGSWAPRTLPGTSSLQRLLLGRVCSGSGCSGRAPRRALSTPGTHLQLSQLPGPPQPLGPLRFQDLASRFAFVPLVRELGRQVQDLGEGTAW